MIVNDFESNRTIDLQKKPGRIIKKTCTGIG